MTWDVCECQLPGPRMECSWCGHLSCFAHSAYEYPNHGGRVRKSCYMCCKISISLMPVTKEIIPGYLRQGEKSWGLLYFQSFPHVQIEMSR